MCRDKRRCHPGYEMNKDGSECVDIDECGSRPGLCPDRRHCVNTPGSFRCRGDLHCSDGRRANDDGTECIDIDECAELAHDCAPDQRCENTPNSFVCRCQDGYVFNSHLGRCEELYARNDCNEGFSWHRRTKTCQDVDECRERPGYCQHRCVNTDGSFRCSCQRGFRLLDDGRSCQEERREREETQGLHGGGGDAAAPEQTRSNGEERTREERTREERTREERNREERNREERNRAERNREERRRENAEGGERNGQRPDDDENNVQSVVHDQAQTQGQETGGGGQVVTRYQRLEVSGGNGGGNGGGIGGVTCTGNCPPMFGGSGSRWRGGAGYCPNGFRMSPTGRTCQDINECALNPCVSADEICLNTPGSYMCHPITCPNHYVKDPSTFSTEAKVKDAEDMPGTCSPVLPGKRGPVTGVSPEDVFSAKRPRVGVLSQPKKT
ncbi:PREDICTED: fibrillin-1-like [Priapulus caudatus]|uniref:Fibrillin-1-like n=1 Tax=Priapulus caudatus TaxID=37621 RepID=A0ABM1F973_PRICU|nr:PREDICTED: fibrillin-1-like [Priapulus caudatus]